LLDREGWERVNGNCILRGDRNSLGERREKKIATANTEKDKEKTSFSLADQSRVEKKRGRCDGNPRKEAAFK